MSFSTQAEIIKNRRTELKISQKKVATYLGYGSSQYISNMERGVSGIPEKDLVKISTILKMGRKDLYWAVLTDHAKRLKKIMGLKNKPKL